MKVMWGMYLINCFKNPGKLMGIVNNISKKLDNKLTSGEINEKELMEEASSLIGKMNNIPGMPNIQDLLKNLNIPRNKQGPHETESKSRKQDK